MSSGLANGGWRDAEEKQSCGRKIAHLFPWVQSSIFGHMHFSAQIPASASFSLFLFPDLRACATVSSEERDCSSPALTFTLHFVLLSFTKMPALLGDSP